MKKIILILSIWSLAIGFVEAQQIKRSTLSSTGKVKSVDPVRVSWTAGSCPGCNVLHPTNPANEGYVRQGFQQPPSNGNAPNCPTMTSTFNITPIVSALCGTKFDMEFTGISVQNLKFEWNFGAGAVPQTSTSLNPMGVIYTTPGQKVISLKVSQGVCMVSSARAVNIAANQVGFSSTAKVTDAKCRGDKSGSIVITTIGGSTATKTYTWSNGATTQNLTNVAAGSYRVTTTDGNGCAFTLDTVVKQPNTAISFTPEIVAETCIDIQDGSILLKPTGGTPPYRYIWSTGATTPGISNLSRGRYTVGIIDTNACRLDTAFVISLACRDTNTFVYDVITPNGDGKNDKWVIKRIEKYPENEMFIYNRWGQLVYTTKKYNNDWAGSNQKGEELPSAAYYYVIRLNDDKNTVWSGSVTVIR
jgi:gliding motility-associated-like protein